MRVCKLLLFLAFGVSIVSAQKFAVIIPSETEQAKIISRKLSTSLAAKLTVLPSDLTETVFKSLNPENVFNLSLVEAQNLGNALGCDYFLVVRAENLRRVSLEKADYYESFAAFFLISTRTGRLLKFKLESFENADAAKADLQIFDSLAPVREEILTAISAAENDEIREVVPRLEEVPEENSPEAVNFVSPLPFRRIRPVYTSTASLYGVKATIDALVDLDEKGQITRFEIVRWAGYGLDESVEKTVREMQWRPAARNENPLAIRFLLRYNFRKID